MEQLIDKQGTLTLSFCVVKPLYEQFFDWNYCVDIGSEGKIWNSEQPFNSLFHWKNENKSLGDVKYTIFLGKSGHFWAFFKSLGRMFWLKTWYIHVFSRKSQKFVIFLGRMQEICASEENIDSFQHISFKYLLFPQPDNNLMTKIWLKGLHLFQYSRC